MIVLNCSEYEQTVDIPFGANGDWGAWHDAGLRIHPPQRDHVRAGVRAMTEAIGALCADLGSNGVMVFGSPKQRETAGLQTPAEAVKRFTEGLATVSAHAEQRGAGNL